MVDVEGYHRGKHMRVVDVVLRPSTSYHPRGSLAPVRPYKHIGSRLPLSDRGLHMRVIDFYVYHRGKHVLVAVEGKTVASTWRVVDVET